MKEVTPDVVAKANAHAADVVRQAEEKALSQETPLSPETAYYLHKAAWASVTGGDAVKVVNPL